MIIIAQLAIPTAGGIKDEETTCNSKHQDSRQDPLEKLCKDPKNLHHFEQSQSTLKTMTIVASLKKLEAVLLDTPVSTLRESNVKEPNYAQ